MLNYIKGEITFKNPTYIIVETAGVGYHINISLQTYALIEKAERAKILIHYHVSTQDYQPTLYGFADDVERNLFRQLISVKGIGLNTARVILSGLTTEEVRAAIVGEDVNTFKRVKGIGAKTAKQIILDLKDKILKDSGETSTLSATMANNTLREEALQALVVLGFNKIQVQKTLNKLLRSQEKFDTVESLIKATMKEFR